MNANRQPSALAARPRSEASDNCLRFLYDAPCCIEKFLTFYGRPGTAVGALKKRDAEFVLDIAQTTTQRRLPDIECPRSLPKASVLGGYNGPPQISELDVHNLVMRLIPMGRFWHQSSRGDLMSCLKQQWLEHRTSPRGHDINLTSSGDQQKDFFDPAGRGRHHTAITPHQSKQPVLSGFRVPRGAR